jgi:UDP-N-acetylglucosamine 2-epimerase (non-hydrolysing)
MIDTLFHNLPRATPVDRVLGEHGGYRAVTDSAAGFALVTLHRPSNVDDPVVLRRLLETLRTVSERLPVVFPIHPRTAARVQAAGLDGLLDSPRLLRTAPLGYLDMLGLMAKARLVLTDSGGIQEETTALGVPCVTLRDNTERPITVSRAPTPSSAPIRRASWRP